MRKRFLACLLLAALLTGSAAGAYLPGASAQSPDVYSAGERITGAGIDVSQFQGDIDWSTAARSIDFAIIRCYARGQADQKWSVNAAACERLGIPYGAYVYSSAKTDAEARSEAAAAVRLLRGKNLRLPVYLDLEDESVRTGCTKAEILRHATIFCDTLRAAGYSGSYSTWQCSNSARIPGIPANVDLNLRYGTSLNAGHTHDYRVTKHAEPTCTDFGSRVYTCSSCGASVTQPLRPLKSCPSKALSDVPAPGTWPHAGVDFCVNTGLMSGIGSERFDPKGTTTRAQTVQILYKLAGAPKVSGKTPFTDLTRSWYRDAVLWAYQTGVTAGTGPTTFSPDAPVTREQLAMLLMKYTDRILKLRHTWTPANLNRFPDGGRVSGWARSAMADAVALGLITGSNDNGVKYLRPQGLTTREQAAVILLAFCQNVKKG